MEAPKIKLSGALEFPFCFIPKDSKNNTPKELNLRAVFRIEAPVLESHHRRASIDLVVVLDVSSSISLADNQLSKLDLLNKSKGFIESNLDDGDRLAIVTFRDNDLIEITREGRRSAKQRVDNLATAAGFATAKLALEQAVKVLDGRPNEEQTRQGFIILVSDRPEKSYDDPNDRWSAGDPALRKYPVHTLGLGKLHDPTELLLVADASSGTYSSVTEASKIMEALAVCLALFKSVVAVDVSVQIAQLPSKDASLQKMTMEILHCDWGGFKREQGSAGSCNRVQGGVLYAGEVKHLIAGINCTFLPTWVGIAHFNLITATATYKRAAQLGEPQSNSTATAPMEMEVQCKLQRISIYGTTITNRILDTNTSTYPSPMFLHQMVWFNLLDKFIGSFFCQNTTNEIKAMANHEVLERMWKEFRRSDESWKAAEKIGLHLQLQRIESDIDAMVSGLKQQGLGVGCVYSWLSSHMMQRAATTGLARPTAFLTPAIEDMVEKARHEQSSAEKRTEQGVDDSAAPADNDNPSHPPAGGSDDRKRAVQLLDGISKRFEEWRKLDCGVPPAAFRPSSEKESTNFTNLTAVLREDIGRAMQYDLYLAAVDAINQWCNSSGSPAAEHSSRHRSATAKKG